MTSWLILAVAIGCEVAGTVCMKQSESLSRWGWVVPMLLAYLLALGGLAVALRTIEVGVAYAVWSAVGTVLIAVVGIVAFDESVTPLKLASMGLVVLGVVGLNLADAARRP